MKPIFYSCSNRTEATDRANIFYINASSARRIKEDTKQIEVTNKAGTTLAVFKY